MSPSGDSRAIYIRMPCFLPGDVKEFIGCHSQAYAVIAMSYIWAAVAGVPPARLSLQPGGLQRCWT